MEWTITGKGKNGEITVEVVFSENAIESVTVTGHGTDWCRVVVDGVEGYMSTWFLKW